MQHGKPAETEVMFVRGSKGRRDSSIPQSVAILSPISGRTHQLRVHLNSGLSLPIVGDKKYGFNKRWHSKLHLHALKISFPEVHSREGGPRHSLVAPVPEHMHKALRALLGKTWEKQVVNACQDMEKHVKAKLAMDRFDISA
jgi:23S rRNA-/tRNA-specific pseudouridylate synthase